MSVRHVFTCLALSFFLFCAHPLLAATPAQLPNFVSLARDLKPAVVNISTTKNIRPRRSVPQLPRGSNDPFEDFFDRFYRGEPRSPGQERSLGSGVIISRDGYILTNEHVIDGADEIKVKLASGRTFTASVQGSDQKLDLALLKISGSDLPFARLGDSEAVEVGAWVMAIGNPFGLDETVTAGIVSAKSRNIGAGPYDDFIQTDASINPGNSGGPLFNLAGEVIGINTAIVAGGQGIGFAIPINAAKAILPQLKRDGHVTRGWLGVHIQPLSDELARSFGLSSNKGALIAEVEKDSPAARAGLRRGDVILAFDGHPIDEVGDLSRRVAATPVERKATLKLVRDGKPLELPVVVGKLNEPRPALSSNADDGKDLIGLRVADITPATARKFDLAGATGVVVVGVAPASPAAAADLRSGDLLLELDGKPISSRDDFERALLGVKKGAHLRLLVQRNENLFYVAVAVE